MQRQPVGLVHDGCRLARRIVAAGVEVFNDAPFEKVIICDLDRACTLLRSRFFSRGLIPSALFEPSVLFLELPRVILGRQARVPWHRSFQ